jgi:hypothetical protein
MAKKKGVITPEKKLRTLLRKKAACKGAEVGAVDKAKVCLQMFAKDDPTDDLKYTCSLKKHPDPPHLALVTVQWSVPPPSTHC